MLDRLKTITHNMFTEPDNVTFCPVRVGSGIVATLYHVAAAVGIFTHGLTLDIGTLGQYMQHMLELVTAGGLTAGAKSMMKGDTK